MTTVSVQANKLLATRIHNIKRSFGRIRYGSVIQTHEKPTQNIKWIHHLQQGYQPKQWTVEICWKEFALFGSPRSWFSIVPIQLGAYLISNKYPKQPGSNPPPTLTFRACNLKGRWITRNSKQNTGKRWGKNEEKLWQTYMKILTTMGFFCEIILCNYCFSSYLLIISSVFMSVVFLQRRLVKLQNFVLQLLDDKPLTSNINELQLLPFDSMLYSKWNDQWLKSVFHLSDFNPFHLNTKFCRRFEAQQRRRRNHGHRQGLSLRLR